MVTIIVHCSVDQIAYNLALRHVSFVNSVELIVILSAIMQGIFEWIPISSSGIVTALCTVLGVRFLESFNWSLALHLGSGIAALLLFWRDFLNILNIRSRHNTERDVPSLKMYIVLILLSIIVGGGLYMFFTRSFHEEIPGRIALGIIGIFLIITGIVDYLYQTRSKHVVESRSLNPIDWIVLGVLQGIAVIPGLSRSGLVLAYLSFRKVKPDVAFKISLIIGAPILILAGIGGLYFTRKLLPLTLASVGVLVSLIVSFVFGYLFYKAFAKMRTWHFALTIGILLIVTCLMSLF